MVRLDRTLRGDRLHRLAVLATVAEAGGVGRGAERLGMAKSSVSHHLAELERDVGVALLIRRGRGIALTAAGEALATHARAMVEEARSAFAAAREMEEPKGLLRISTPGGIADALIVPMLAAFLDAHPRLLIEVLATDVVADLAADRIDIAFRIVGTPDQRHVVRRMWTGTDIFVAAPSYLSRTAPIERPSDLAAHPFIGFAAFGAAPTFTITGPDGDCTETTVTCRVLTTSGIAIKQWALAGLGVARMPDFALEEDLARGRLDRVLPMHSAGSPSLFAAYLPARYRPANVRRLIDHAIRHFATRTSGDV